MTKKIKVISAIILMVLILTNLASALTIKSVSTDIISPGQEGAIRIELENNLDDQITSVSFKLDFTNIPLNPIGNSEDSVEEIDENDDEEFIFKIKAANDIKPGDYKIPYSVFYTINNEQRTKSGAIGITVKGNAELVFSIETDKPVIGQQDKLTLKIVNKGLANARFVSVKINPSGFILLSDGEVYIGNVDSDDFETATFDVLYNNLNPTLIGTIEYKDFDNKQITKTVNVPIIVYTQEKAIELGLIKKDNTLLYIIIIITLILIFILYRTIRKSMRNAKRNKSQQA